MKISFNGMEHSGPTPISLLFSMLKSCPSVNSVNGIYIADSYERKWVITRINRKNALSRVPKLDSKDPSIKGKNIFCFPSENYDKLLLIFYKASQKGMVNVNNKISNNPTIAEAKKGYKEISISRKITKIMSKIIMDKIC